MYRLTFTCFSLQNLCRLLFLVVHVEMCANMATTWLILKWIIWFAFHCEQVTLVLTLSEITYAKGKATFFFAFF